MVALSGCSSPKVCPTRADGTCASTDGCGAVFGWVLDEARDCLVKKESVICLKERGSSSSFEPPSCYAFTTEDGQERQVFLSILPSSEDDPSIHPCSAHKSLCP